MELMSGMDVRRGLLEDYKRIIEEENLDIKLVILQVGNNESSNTYIKNKIKYTEAVGIETELFKLDEGTTNKDLINIINSLNNDDRVTGIILQSPTPKHIDFDLCARLISPAKDVDGFTEENLFAIRDNNEKILPCTVKGILKLLNYYNIDVEGKNTVVIGRSNIVGRPLFDALVNRDATVTLCHSKTRNLRQYTKRADILISATGQPNLITENMVKPGFVGVDVGISFVDGKMVGDFSKDTYEYADYITPVPGGVGPMTVAMIIDNLITLKREENNNKVFKKRD